MADYPAPRRFGPSDPRHADGAQRSPVVMVHGFTQTAGCIGPLAEALAAHRTVVLPDAPGHGTADAFAALDCPSGADRLAGACGRGVWVGYSLGGRLALHVALAHPDEVDALVLIGATAGLADDAQRRARRATDHDRARHLEAVGVDQFVAEWLAADLFAALPGWARFTEERTANTVAGLAGSLRNAGTGAMHPLWDRLGQLEMPVLCLAGDRDPTYSTLAARIAGAIGTNARWALVPGAGHAAHLEQPETTTAVVSEFLSRLTR